MYVVFSAEGGIETVGSKAIAELTKIRQMEGVVMAATREELESDRSSTTTTSKYGTSRLHIKYTLTFHPQGRTQETHWVFRASARGRVASYIHDPKSLKPFCALQWERSSRNSAEMHRLSRGKRYYSQQKKEEKEKERKKKKEKLII